ncbi:LEC14B-like [Citrus sinensis]|uniref:LEC14B-like n=1 Tax=Citrus sinensis TaxID=2711 RepID=A0ACB8I9L1_CITSI|nr:LEC14B-like [Citrus sinensis]
MGRFGKGVSSRDDGYASSSGSLSQGGNGQSDYLDHEIAQLTKLRSQPHEFLSRTAPGKLRLPVSTVKMLVGREVNYSGRGRFSAADSCHVLSRYLPVNGPWKVDGMNSRVYTSHFSNDGSFFVAASQESNIKIYNVDKNWKIQKDIETKALRWTITDTSLSPDQRFLVYASICAIVNIVDVGSSTRESLANVTEIHEGLDFSADGDEDEFGIFSVKFSTDGQELVAAGSDNFIYVYDLQANKCSLRIPAHKSDVNTVCFADETGHLIFSGSDDSLCKVWDRRCFISKGRANGVLMGHLEGITFIDSRRDGRYFISNGKDQTTKLWDIRKMSSNTTDTAQKYIYTGSSDNSVYIYDLVSGAQVAKLDFHNAPVRDCCWHPIYPMLISSSWDCNIVRWEIPGIGEAPLPKRRTVRARRFFGRALR